MMNRFKVASINMPYNISQEYFDNSDIDLHSQVFT